MVLASKIKDKFLISDKIWILQIATHSGYIYKLLLFKLRVRSKYFATRTTSFLNFSQLLNEMIKANDLNHEASDAENILSDLLLLIDIINSLV